MLTIRYREGPEGHVPFVDEAYVLNFIEDHLDRLGNLDLAIENFPASLKLSRAQKLKTLQLLLSVNSRPLSFARSLPQSLESLILKDFYLQ